MARRPVITFFAIGLVLVFGFLYHVNQSTTQLPKQNSLLTTWKACMLEKSKMFENDSNKGWSGWGTVINDCGKFLVGRLNLTGFKNKDEVKYMILPIAKSNVTVVTMGIGHDTEAEEKIRDAVGSSNSDFYGADPMIDGNEMLYNQIGKFFPFAVSGKAGYQNASVTKGGGTPYFNKVVVTVDLLYFLKDLIAKNFYDMILMDAEYAEYFLYPFIVKGGALDQNGIAVCQWNMEIHLPTESQKKLTHDFFLKLIEEERYGFFNAYMAAGHLRLYFLNFEDEECRKRYIGTKLAQGL